MTRASRELSKTAEKRIPLLGRAGAHQRPRLYKLLFATVAAEVAVAGLLTAGVILFGDLDRLGWRLMMFLLAALLYTALGFFLAEQFMLVGSERSFESALARGLAGVGMVAVVTALVIAEIVIWTIGAFDETNQRERSAGSSFFVAAGFGIGVPVARLMTRTTTMRASVFASLLLLGTAVLLTVLGIHTELELTRPIIASYVLVATSLTVTLIMSRAEKGRAKPVAAS